MAISKEKKQDLLQEYTEKLKVSNSTVVIQQKGVEVNDINAMRKELHAAGAELKVVRKRLFLKAVKDAGLQDVDHATLQGSIAILYSGEDEMVGLKVINKFAKELKKEKKGSLVFLGAWMEKDRKVGEYIAELADMPSKEELLSKLVYLLNYPVQSFAATLHQIADKIGDGEIVSVVEEKKEEASAVAEVMEEIKAEAPKEDAAG